MKYSDSVRVFPFARNVVPIKALPASGALFSLFNDILRCVRADTHAARRCEIGFFSGTPYEIVRKNIR